MIVFPSKNDILTAMKNHVCYKSQVLIGGNVVQSGLRPTSYAGGYASVLPFITAGGIKIAVRLWFADIGDPKKRMSAISSYLNRLKSPYFIKFDYHDDAIVINGKAHPIVTMDWVDYPTLKEFIQANISNRALILQVAANFKSMVNYFHINNIAHGDLSHGNIKVKTDGSLVVVDYDSMFIHDLNGMADVVKGLPGYQHPARYSNPTINHKLDYFSELVIYLSLLVFADYPAMWQNYYETEDLLFSKQDYESPLSSSLFAILLNSSNQQIVHLTKEMIEYLKHKNISDLKPLETIIQDDLDKIINDIINKF